MPLSSRITLRALASLTGSTPVNDLGTGSAQSMNVDQLIDFTLSDGTGIGAADKVFSDTRTVNASTNDDIDLAGTLTDAFGAALTFVKVKGLYVRSAPANTQAFTVGAAAANGVTSMLAPVAITMRPGGALLLTSGATDTTGYAVVAATGDLLRVANGAGAAISYDIVIIGTSA